MSKYTRKTKGSYICFSENIKLEAMVVAKIASDASIAGMCLSCSMLEFRGLGQPAAPKRL